MLHPSSLLFVEAREQLELKSANPVKGLLPQTTILIDFDWLLKNGVASSIRFKKLTHEIISNIIVALSYGVTI